ncbi:MAG: trypsin-like peptidase domain-containing protein [Deltaproteobacteria bacterium]|nr:trypsin-like peptidase domain-containing protein [Deltaproteobacteria bacterium]
MTEWRINGDNQALALYRSLQKVAEQIIEKPDPLTHRETSLSQDDMTLWLQSEDRQGFARKALCFIDQNTGLKHTLFDDLSKFYNQMVSLDKKDGRIDGKIVSLPSEILVLDKTASIWDNIKDQWGSVFSVDLKTQSGIKTAGTAWIADKEQTADGAYRYWVISNAHVVDLSQRQEFSRTLTNHKTKKTYETTLVGGDHAYDIAGMYFDTRDVLTPFVMNNAPASTGDRIAVVGNQIALGNAYTEGQINDNEDFASSMPLPLYQHDANATNGNSGSPAFNEKGEVIGVVALQVQANAQIGYIIPSRYVMEAYTAIRASYNKGTGELGTHSVLGQLDVTCQVMNTDTLKQLGISAAYGYYVALVGAGSAAEQAGLKAGDIILSYDAKPVSQSISEMQYALSRYKEGDRVALEVVSTQRPDQPKKIAYTIVAQTMPLETGVWESSSGFTAIDLTPDQRKIFGDLVQAKTGGGMIFNQATPAGVPASLIGTGINGVPTPTVAMFREGFEKMSEEDRVIIFHAVKGTASQGGVVNHHRFLLNGTRLKGSDMPVASGQSVSMLSAFAFLGFEGARLNSPEKAALGVPQNIPAFYVQETSEGGRDLMEDELFEGDVVVGFEDYHLNQKTSAPCWDSLPWLKICHIEGLQDYMGRNVSRTKWVNLNVLRNGKSISVKRKMGGAEDDQSLRVIETKAGDPFTFGTKELTADERMHLGLADDGPGVYVTSPQAGEEHPYKIEAGMVITRVNGVEIYDSNTLEDILKESRLLHRPVFFEVEGSKKWMIPGIKMPIEVLIHAE